jgi:hypothetical protein
MCVVLTALVCVGCNDNDQLPTTPLAAAPSRAGLSGGPLAGTLTVYAVDADTGAPIPGATVWLGAGAEAKEIGHTASGGGLVREHVEEPQTVSVRAAGYAAASWSSVASSVIVMPLESQAARPANADVTVSVAGWSDLPPLAEGKYRVASFAYSLANDLESLEAVPDASMPTCVQLASKPSNCTVTISMPVASAALLVTIAEADDAGTPDDASDDELTMTRLGVATDLALRPSAPLSVSLALLDPRLTAQARIEGRPSTDVLQEVVGVPGITMGSGQVLIYPSLGSSAKTFLVPTAAGAFADATLWAVSTAGGEMGSDWTRSYERGIAPPADADTVVTLPTSELLELPSIFPGLASDYDLFTTASSARLEFTTPSGEELKVLLFPTRESYVLPSGVLSGQPDHASIAALDVEIDPTSFEFRDLAEQAKHIAYAHTELEGSTQPSPY